MKKALCIGINYKDTEFELFGCINDADDWAHLLNANGFDTAILAERQATKKNILGGIQAVVRALQPGDTGFVTFSGHGTWVPDRTGDEPDGRDEAFVPADADMEDGRGLVLDDEVKAVLDEVPNGSHLVLITDCCHSGTIYRMAAHPALTRRRVRFLPPAHYLKTNSLVSSMDRAFGQPAVKKSNGPSPGVVHFSVCRDVEYSIDAEINGRPNGAFTYVATRVFAEVAAEGGTYARAHKEIRKHLPAADFPQTPLLNAPAPLKKVKLFG